MDKAAFIAATRFARRTVVTARSEQVDFRVPVRQGQLVELVARVGEVGRSSMQVDVELYTEDPHAGTRHLCTSGRFVMIALDANGRTAPIAG
ncbi:acyl-CoA thioesterase [Lysobacter solisilvae]|uniref:Acyl-CoA thioesterase n=2 Tax=Agrilutibacter solisilvae TaxID=2763317 RepID=A0A975ATJ4_9GAMM|nr:acyl-CoA thioesterase [Lysobacter solisilvae]